MSVRKEPNISVIMGTLYTKKDVGLLKRAIDSILNQTYKDFEFLICDDGSNNEAKVFLEKTALEDNRIKLVRNQNKSIDLASKLNLCLIVSKGKFIARMDDDDWSRPDRLEKEINFLINNQEIAFVGSNVCLIQNGIKIGERYFPRRPNVEDFYMVQPYIHSTLLFRSSIFRIIQGYSEDKDCVLCEDFDLLLRIYEKGLFGANIQETLLDYTIPTTAKGKRKMSHRINETKTRFRRFKALNRLPKALPFVIKPVIVGLIPDKMLKTIKRR